ncbi:CBS domain protein [Leptospira weilii str. 2006001853]|uniref:CBS domain protein n=1 Tax=Leptospira weilii str. 2006001853 TaxID=1001589 RepID=A0A828Z6U2_9LEPT|nr:CBS domain-containing protein [Leptospira weilii]EKR66147.1 CBS domain protein [Leptospira weilii str. 2006001853]EMN46597.1 CBS domain protein [Leptospira weilii str. LNT 1234]MDL5246299.1 CBS domain-containing protein [Leptospira weilii]QDK23739.1 CBS domain-containing protein [Leptospira weilii]QDK26625.1 CBS domain-containing protein [Leptospira weilii]
MYIKQILAKKDRKLLSVEPETLVMDAVKFMTKYDIGSVIILTEGKLKGIFTERDVLHLSAELGLDFFKKSVSEVMSTSLTTMTPEDDVDELLSIMLKKRIRHMPILEDGLLVGIVSIGDAVKAKIEKTEEENKNLKQYMYNENGFI